MGQEISSHASHMSRPVQQWGCRNTPVFKPDNLLGGLLPPGHIAAGFGRRQDSSVLPVGHPLKIAAKVGLKHVPVDLARYLSVVIPAKRRAAARRVGTQYSTVMSSARTVSPGKRVNLGD